MGTHYTRERRIAAYLSKIQIGDPAECWPWTGATKTDGYGLVWNENGRYEVASKWGYRHLVGPIAPSLEVCHTCDNPPCQNPGHWFLGTRRDNTIDMMTKGRGRYVLPDNSGAKHGMARLTPEQVAEIRRRFAAGGIFQRDLAAEFGVRQQQISRIVNNKTWHQNESSSSGSSIA